MQEEGSMSGGPWVGLVDDTRIRRIRPLIPPAVLQEELPISERAATVVSQTRGTIRDVLSGSDGRLLVVVGPCSIHDPEAALEYARRLSRERERLGEDIVVVMRVYFEKPRTTVGWKGLINDPGLNGSYRVNSGLRIARKLLFDVVDGYGQPVAGECLDTITPQFLAEFMSYGAIGARTTESQVHRELASGLSFPVGFKNGTSGSIHITVEAILAACEPHCFLSVTKQGIAAVVETEGNPDCHAILRGSAKRTNYDAESVAHAADLLRRAELPQRVVIDCSHGNSQKDHVRQVGVAATVAEQIGQGSPYIAGVMIESNIRAGRQKVQAGKTLVYGQSITDACIGWDDTVAVLEGLAQAVRSVRSTRNKIVAA